MRKTALLLPVIFGLLIVFFFTRGTRFSAAVVTEGPSVTAVYATGEVEPVTWARVSSLVTAQLLRFLVDEGEEVKAGQTLAVLDSREVTARVQQLAAKEKLQRIERERLDKLFRSKSASREELDRAVQTHEQVVYELAEAQASLENYELIAPIDGKVLRRDGEIGELIPKEQTVLWVGRERPLRIEAEIDEEYIPQVKAGLKVGITADAFSGEALPGVVERITPKGDPLKKSFRIWIGLPEDTPLQIGMTVEVNIITKEDPKALLVPQNALLRDSLWVVQEGQAVRRRVQVGSRGNGRAAITKGVAPGELVLLDPKEDFAERFAVRRLDIAPPG